MILIIFVCRGGGVGGGGELQGSLSFVTGLSRSVFSYV